MALPENHHTIQKCAQIAGISRDTFGPWVFKAGFEFNREARGRGNVALTPESVLQKIIADHSVRLAKIQQAAGGGAA